MFLQFQFFLASLRTTVHAYDNNQRWSRGHKARGQGHKKIRGQGQPFRGQNLSRFKDRNAQGQVPKTQAQALSKKKGLQKFFSGDLQFIGVPRIFDWGRPKPQIT